MTDTDAFAGFVTFIIAVYLVSVILLGTVYMFKNRRAPKTKLEGPRYTAWIRCDTQRPVSKWSAVSCGDDPDDLCIVTRAEYKAKKFSILVLPTSEKP